MAQNIIYDKTPILRDWAHAAAIFTPEALALAPKSNHIFHVWFEINRDVKLTNESLRQKHKYDISILAKSVTLPGFKIETKALNQYNRKTMVQSTHSYNPVDIIFHNDNMGMINELWRSYYAHYYQDPITAHSVNGYDRNAFQKAPSYAFGHKGQITPFFQSITIFHMGKHEYASYKLVNPMVASFGHKQLDYFSREFHDFDMSLNYEAVEYGTGITTNGSVTGFAVDKYDHGLIKDKINNPNALVDPTFPVTSDKKTMPVNTVQQPIKTTNQSFDKTSSTPVTSSTTGVNIPVKETVISNGTPATQSNIK